MAAKRRHQNTSAPENGRTKQSLQVSGKSKTVKKKDKENEQAYEDVTSPVQQWNAAYVTLVAALGELFTVRCCPGAAGGKACSLPAVAAPLHTAGAAAPARTGAASRLLAGCKHRLPAPSFYTVTQKVTHSKLHIFSYTV